MEKIKIDPVTYEVYENWSRGKVIINEEKIYWDWSYSENWSNAITDYVAKSNASWLECIALLWRCERTYWPDFIWLTWKLDCDYKKAYKIVNPDNSFCEFSVSFMNQEYTKWEFFNNKHMWKKERFVELVYSKDF